MPVDIRSVLLRIGLPVAGGVTAGILLTSPKTVRTAANVRIDPSADVETSPAPASPELMKLAALAGRTSETKARINALLASGANDGEIAGWLAVVLVSDPAWLEKFILTVPEPRRIDLVRATFWKIGDLHPDAVWDLLRSSPFAALAARSTGTDTRYKGLQILGPYQESSLAAEVLFDPAHGFPDEAVTTYFRHGTGSEINSTRILEEWTSGRWKGDPPECVRSAWLSLRWTNTEALREIESKIPTELRKNSGEFEALARLQDDRTPITESPGADQLRLLGPVELADLAESRAEAARPLPLATLARLPTELRKPAIARYFNWIYPFQAEAAAQCIESLDQIDLTNSEKQVLLESAASHEGDDRGDYQTALKWAARIPDAKARMDCERNLLQDWARQDPQAALQHVETMPAGELRDQTRQTATDALP